MELRRAWLAACVAALHAGCAGVPAPAREVAAPSEQAAAKPAAPRPAGLSLERLFVPEDPRVRRDGLAQAVADGLIEPVECGLAGAGFAAYRLRRGLDADRLIALLGGSPQRHETLLGRLVDWADAAQAAVDDGRMLFLAGRSRAMPESNLLLLLRGWCFPTVDSARARIELRLVTEGIRSERPSIERAATRPRARVVSGTETVVELAPGEALVVVEAPVVPPDEGEDGLAALPPPTPAALLLGERSIPGRATVLVVRASFADMLPPSR